MMHRVLDQLTGLGRRRPRLTLAAFAVVALACALGALGLQPSTNLDTLVPSGSADFRATQVAAQQFGSDPVVVLVREPLQDLVGSKDLGTLSELEACLDGSAVSANQSLAAFVPVPAAKAKPYGGAASPCGHLMATKPVKVVYGPATFLNQAVIAINQEIGRLESSASAAIKAKEAQARQVAARQHLSRSATKQLISAVGQGEQQQQLSQLEQLALSSGLSISDIPSIANTNFIDTVVFDATRGAYVPKARFSYLFPSPDAALIQVRLRAGLTDAQQAAAIHWITAATRLAQFRLGHGGTYVVSGEPVVLNDLSTALSGQVALLLIGAVLVMGAVLLAIFRRRLRLLPLGLALAAAAITFGLCALAGGTLTMASIAVLPILIGLAVDYGIQFQSLASGASTIAAAALATGTGFLVLLLSPVPMVQGFGLLLVVGVLVAFLIVMCAGSAALVVQLRGPRAPDGLVASWRGAGELLAPVVGWTVPVARRAACGVGRAGSVARRAGRANAGAGAALGRWLAAALLGAGEILAAPLRRGGAGSGRTPSPSRSAPPRTGIARLAARPRTVLAVGLLLAAAGWAVDPLTPVQSDVTKLVPANLPALHGLDTLEKVAGVSGELGALIHGANVASPATIAWMVSYENRIDTHYGYTETKGCSHTLICPALSLPDLFSATSGSTSASSLSQTQINTLLDAVPAYFSQAVINHSRTYAEISFGIPLMPLVTQRRLIAYMRSQLNPPRGETAQLAGLPVLAADADASLSSAPRRMLTLLAGLVAVALMLLVIFRRPRRALVPLIPIVLATGWSALVVWAIGIPLNPMSATLGALVIAISTEFSVLLAERFRRQRLEGEAPIDALTSAYASTGRAVVASGITAIAGFAVLIVSDVTMLRDFGIVTLIDMSVSLLGVLAALPAVLVLSETGWRVSRSRRRPRSGPRGRLLRRARSGQAADVPARPTVAA